MRGWTLRPLASEYPRNTPAGGFGRPLSRPIRVPWTPRYGGLSLVPSPQSPVSLFKSLVPLFLFLCFVRLAAQSSPTPEPLAAAPQNAAPQIRLALIPEEPRPGEPLSIAVSGAEGAGLRAVLVSPQGRLSQAVFFSIPLGEGRPPLLAALLAVPSTARPGAASIRVEAGGKVLGEASLTIGGRDFVAEEISLNQGNTDILTRPDPQKTAESDQLWGILNRTGAEIYSPGPFVPPVASTRRTSFFGDRRVYRYVNGSSSTSIHAGVDYGVPRGTPVSACAAGKVILARFRIVTGNSVILEHLPGVYSLYYHLDEIKAAEGDLVEGGSFLGFSGSTGLSTGPHLHWEIRVAGENTDPDAFTARPVLDKDALLGKLNGKGKDA